MKSKFLTAAVIASGGMFAGLVTGTTVAPAAAACAPSFTSIPCTIVDNVSKAPGDIANGLAAAPGQLTVGLATAPLQLAGVEEACPRDDDGNLQSCGLVAAPGQFFGDGVTQIVTAPTVIAGQLAAAPSDLAGGLAAAPGQFIRAIQNGGTDPESE